MVQTSKDGFVEIWDEDENRNAFQLFIDFDKETVEYKPYD